MSWYYSIAKKYFLCGARGASMKIVQRAGFSGRTSKNFSLAIEFFSGM
jgi:hypothetical protein